MTSVEPLMIIRQFYPAYELQALCEFSGTRYTLEQCRYPTVESTGMLPQIQLKGVLLGGDRALHYVRDMTALEASLSSTEAANSRGLIALVHSTLGNVDLWSQYLCSAGRGRSTANSIHKLTPFPFSWLLVSGLREKIRPFLQQSGMEEESWVRKRAEEAYKALDAVLAGSGGPYFFGST